ITTYANQLKDQIARAKVQPDINEITNKLDASPAVSLNLNYVAEMINLADKDTDRVRKKAEIMTQIDNLRQARIVQLETERKQQEEAEKQRQAEEAKQQKISQVKNLITSAKAILEKTAASKAEVEQTISSLKTLTTATSDSLEAQFDLPSDTPPPEPAPSPFPSNESWRPLVEEIQQALRAEQQATKMEIQNDLQAAQSPQATAADQVKAIRNLGKIDGEEDLEEEKTQLESVAETLFVEDPLEFKKQLTELEEKVVQVAKTSEKEQIEKLKKEILTFACSNNVYKKAHREQAQALLTQLENSTQTQSSQKFPFE
ncbi:19991_t:CDS:2, partial [Funneliformis geosporum]